MGVLASFEFKADLLALVLPLSVFLRFPHESTRKNRILAEDTQQKIQMPQTNIRHVKGEAFDFYNTYTHSVDYIDQYLSYYCVQKTKKSYRSVCSFISCSMLSFTKVKKPFLTT
jgi:hypothetical protein